MIIFCSKNKFSVPNEPMSSISYISQEQITDLYNKKNLVKNRIQRDKESLNEIEKQSRTTYQYSTGPQAEGELVGLHAR